VQAWEPKDLSLAGPMPRMVPRCLVETGKLSTSWSSTCGLGGALQIGLQIVANRVAGRGRRHGVAGRGTWDMGLQAEAHWVAGRATCWPRTESAKTVYAGLPSASCLRSRCSVNGDLGLGLGLGPGPGPGPGSGLSPGLGLGSGLGLGLGWG